MRKIFQNYTFFDFAEDQGELVLSPLIIIAVLNFFESIINGVDEISFLLDILFLVVILFSLTCIILKRKNKLHVVWIRTIPNLLIYWYVFWIYAVIQVIQDLLISKITGSEISQQVLFGFVAGTISCFLLLYQTKPWLKQRYKTRHEKLEFFKKKAKLKEEEWYVLRSQIESVVKEKNKISWGWKSVEILFVIALASLLDAYSGQIADLIQNAMSYLGN